MTELIEEAKWDLLTAGWTPDRVYDISQYEEYYIKNGYVINDVIRNALRNFGGLHFTTPTVNKEGKRASHFDAIMSLDNACFHHTQVFEKYTDGPVLPIGECSSGYVTTLMAHSGKMYGVYAGFYYIGDDICDFINRLYIPEQWQEIIVPEMKFC